MTEQELKEIRDSLTKAYVLTPEEKHEHHMMRLGQIVKLLDEVEWLKEKHHVEMNNYRGQVQIWQSEYDAKLLALYQENERLRNELTSIIEDRQKLRRESEYFSEEITRLRKALEEILYGDSCETYDGIKKTASQALGVSP